MLKNSIILFVKFGLGLLLLVSVAVMLKNHLLEQSYFNDYYGYYIVLNLMAIIFGYFLVFSSVEDLRPILGIPGLKKEDYLRPEQATFALYHIIIGLSYAFFGECLIIFMTDVPKYFEMNWLPIVFSATGYIVFGSGIRKIYLIINARNKMKKSYFRKHAKRFGG